MSFLLSAGGAAFIFPNTSVYPEATQRITTRPGTLTHPRVIPSLRDSQKSSLDPGLQPMTPGACLGPEMQNLAVNLFPVPVDVQPKCSRIAAFRDHSTVAKLWSQTQIRALCSSFEHLGQRLRQEPLNHQVKRRVDVRSVPSEGRAVPKSVATDSYPPFLRGEASSI